MAGILYSSVRAPSGYAAGENCQYKGGKGPEDFERVYGRAETDKVRLAETKNEEATGRSCSIQGLYGRIPGILQVCV